MAAQAIEASEISPSDFAGATASLRPSPKSVTTCSRARLWASQANPFREIGYESVHGTRRYNERGPGAFG